MLTIIETDPETGLDTIVKVDPQHVHRPPMRDHCQFGWIPWQVWGVGSDGNDLRGDFS